MDRLKSKVAVITGCSSGVGAATAQKFAAEGAKVVISARRQQQLEEVADKIRAAGGEVLPVVGDISKPEDAQALIDKAVEAYGAVDVLINNAGVLDTGLKPIDRVVNEDLNRILDTSVGVIASLVVNSVFPGGFTFAWMERMLARLRGEPLPAAEERGEGSEPE